MRDIFRRSALASLGAAFGFLVCATAYHDLRFGLTGAALSFLSVALIGRFGLPS
jgi:hypothetical protein